MDVSEIESSFKHVKNSEVNELDIENDDNNFDHSILEDEETNYLVESDVNRYVFEGEGAMCVDEREDSDCGNFLSHNFSEFIENHVENIEDIQLMSDCQQSNRNVNEDFLTNYLVDHCQSDVNWWVFEGEGAMRVDEREDSDCDNFLSRNFSEVIENHVENIEVQLMSDYQQSNRNVSEDFLTNMDHKM